MSATRLKYFVLLSILAALATLGLLPIGRIRQPRQFPAAIPEEPVVYLIWTDPSLSKEHLPALERLCAKVTYLGHSSTPYSCPKGLWSCSR